jgi:hypothetical protein
MTNESLGEAIEMCGETSDFCYFEYAQVAERRSART